MPKLMPSTLKTSIKMVGFFNIRHLIHPTVLPVRVELHAIHFFFFFLHLVAFRE